HFPRVPSFPGVSSSPRSPSILGILGARVLYPFGFFGSRTPAVSRGFHEAPGDESLQDCLGLAGDDKNLLHGELGTTEEFEPGLCLILEKEAGLSRPRTLVDSSRNDAV